MEVTQWWMNDMRSRVEPGFCQFMAKIGWQQGDGLAKVSLRVLPNWML